MSCKSLSLALIIVCLLAGPAPAAGRPLVELGPWSEADLARIIAAAPGAEAPGERIAALSGNFLGTPYVADTLVGGPHTAERLVVDLAGFDCFTFLDQVEALRCTAGPADFPHQLQQVRYRGGEVAYTSRRHFFSDWVAGDGGRIVDLTAAVGRGRARVVVKQLNRKGDGSLWLPGIPVVRREIAYLPPAALDREVLSNLRTGDYVGIYTDRAGLDVSHVGLLVKQRGRFLLRHASSRKSARRVVDVDLLEYLQGKPGLVVYRAR